MEQPSDFKTFTICSTQREFEFNSNKGKGLDPQKLKQLVLDTIHHKHPGQVGMLALAKLVWWPRIHSENVSKAKACRNCIDKGKNLKAIIPKNQLGDLPKLKEPNEEIQMDFAGPIPYKNSTQNNSIKVTVDRLSRFPHAETFHNCDTETAIDYLEKFCKLHGIPRSIRCYQAQAFKAKKFNIICKNQKHKTDTSSSRRPSKNRNGRTPNPNDQKTFSRT